MFEVFLWDFSYVLLNVWERICYVLVTPESCVKQHIDNGLFLNQHLIGFILYSFWYFGSL